MINVQTIAAFSKLTNTAAEPMSLARPESSFASLPTLSTIASILELSNSTIKISTNEPISKARSIPSFPNHKPRGVNRQTKSNSYLKAASCLNAAQRP